MLHSAVSITPLRFLSQLLIQSLSPVWISQLCVSPVSHFRCPLSVIFLLVFQAESFFPITFQHCVICDGCIPSTSPHARCLCCLEQKCVSEHCATNCCLKPQTWEDQKFKLQWCLLDEIVETFQILFHIGSRSQHPSGQNTLFCPWHRTSSWSLLRVLSFLSQVQSSSAHTLCFPSCHHYIGGNHKL